VSITGPLSVNFLLQWLALSLSLWLFPSLSPGATCPCLSECVCLCLFSGAKAHLHCDVLRPTGHSPVKHTRLYRPRTGWAFYLWARKACVEMPVPSFLNQVGGSVYRECGAGYGLLVGVLGFLRGGLRFRQPHLRPITRNIWHGRRNNEVQVLVVPLNAHGTLNKPPYLLLQWPHKSLSSATHGHKLKLAYNCLFNCFRAVGGFDSHSYTYYAYTNIPIPIPIYCGKNHISMARRKSFMCEKDTAKKGGVGFSQASLVACAPKCRLY